MTNWSRWEPSGYHSLWILANKSSSVQPLLAYFDSYCPLLSVMCSLLQIWNWFALRGHHLLKRIMSHSWTLKTNQNELLFQIEDHQARIHALQSWAHTFLSCGLLFDQLHLLVNFRSSHVSYDVTSAFAFIIVQMGLFVQGKRCYGQTIS